MTTLAERFIALPSEQRRLVQLRLCEKALKVWIDYAATVRSIAYTESVCGTHQEVDKELPSAALDSVSKGRDVSGIVSKYLEPISAMHDDDLQFPNHIEFAYYSIYNLFCRWIGKEPVDDWLIVNQALSAHQDEESWSIHLADAIAQAQRGESRG